MKNLFVNCALGSVGRPNKSRNSKEIKTRRYKEEFFTEIVLRSYPTLNFIAFKFGFDIKRLLELFLENLYNEAKIDEYALQMEFVEEAYENPTYEVCLLIPVLLQFTSSIEGKINSGKKILQILNTLSMSEICARFIHRATFKQQLFYVSNGSHVKFYSRANIQNRINKLLEKLEIKESKGSRSSIGYIRHMKKTIFLYDSNLNREIEAIFSRYFLVYLKKQKYPLGR